MSDLPEIHFCTSFVQIPKTVMWVYRPTLTLKSDSDPVEQVVRAALAAHATADRPRPAEVYVLRNQVHMPVPVGKEEGDG